MKQRAELLDRLEAAQAELRRRFLEAVSPSLQSELAEVGSITVHQMEVVRLVSEPHVKSQPAGHVGPPVHR